MGVLGYISRRKAQFQDYTVEKRRQMILKKTEKVQQENIRQAEITEAKQKLHEAQTIQQDLRQAQGPSSIQKFGQGIKRTIDAGKKAKVKIRATGRGPRAGIIPSTGGRPLEVGRGYPFGGTRPLDVGGSGFQFGKQKKRS